MTSVLKTYKYCQIIRDRLNSIYKQLKDHFEEHLEIGQRIELKKKKKTFSNTVNRRTIYINNITLYIKSITLSVEYQSKTEIKLEKDSNVYYNCFFFVTKFNRVNVSIVILIKITPRQLHRCCVRPLIRCSNHDNLVNTSRIGKISVI